ncbi:methyltransferase domain-containing protein [Bradyrhizobium sp. CSA207]|uniref:class I SAM-dependent methyltransferase n=1 Tax=Bradyrhizobium sp. CSA207 TaxID=2698826 RepID=UPI0023AFB43A|nr:class I SAM-dependent methyltransferase [Bradyrhizobium sp. CSA207]MDE5445200.1 methyltransferase domain-containing protein [Bradyrhizobium sp. CSA207]
MIAKDKDNPVVVELAAGTGILTKALAEANASGYAVEPNAAMRDEAIRLGNGAGSFDFVLKRAEATGLPQDKVDWIVIGNGFHLVDTEQTLKEALRLLRRQGYFTAIWLMNDVTTEGIQKSTLELFRRSVPTLPNLDAVVEGLMVDLTQDPRFNNSSYMESIDTIEMTPLRYIEVWRSSNYVSSLAGSDLWNRLLSALVELVGSCSVTTRWRTRAWTVQLSE